MLRETLFTKIVAREVPADIVYEDELCLAFRDISPQAPTHVLVIPKEPVESVATLDESEHAALAGHLLLACKRVAAELGLADSGYRVVANCGADGGQTVDHLHLHVLGGRALSWPPG